MSDVGSDEFENEVDAENLFFNTGVERSDGEDGYLSNGEPDIPGNPEHMDVDDDAQKAAYQKKYDKYNRRRLRQGNQQPEE